MTNFGQVPPGKMCDRCDERPATGMWTGDEGAMAAIHGSLWWWCERCMVEAQLVRARERAAAIPELERRLAELEGDHA